MKHADEKGVCEFLVYLGLLRINIVRDDLSSKRKRTCYFVSESRVK